MRFLLPSVKCSAAPPSFRLCCLNCAQRFDLITTRSAIVWSWEEPPYIWLTIAKNAFVGRALNLRVRMLLKGAVIRGEWCHFRRPCALFLAGVEFHILPRVLVCLLVEFDLLFAFGVLACRILDCASLLCELLSGKLRCLRLKLELLAFGMWLAYPTSTVRGISWHLPFSVRSLGSVHGSANSIFQFSWKIGISKYYSAKC